MAQYSFLLPFSHVPDANKLEWNRDLVEWRCDHCDTCIADREDIISHVRGEHENGTIWPMISSKGRELLTGTWTYSYGAEATRTILSLITPESELKLLESLGASPGWVNSQSIEGVTVYHPYWVEFQDDQRRRSRMYRLPAKLANISDWDRPELNDILVDTDLIGLRKIFVDRFNESELRNLCFDLEGVNYDNLPGSNKQDKARELVGFFKRRNRVLELYELLLIKRPDITKADVTELGNG